MNLNEKIDKLINLEEKFSMIPEEEETIKFLSVYKDMDTVCREILDDPDINYLDEQLKLAGVALALRTLFLISIKQIKKQVLERKFKNCMEYLHFCEKFYKGMIAIII